ncbi:hypothetical protein DPMN_018724 [Dreissena polymorpha]|uniref:Uncharacterized protein n=1 Tax=Dreissena polymorpha TaxID=45954 RepID=A0A9D4NHT9_DREPO|nr:hypothetical protein DPMN_018724 [Dreissena polymorpha]
MSFIEPQNVVAPKIDVAHYQEGDLIKATYQKQTYDAVISEIHQFSDQTPTEPRDKLPVKRSMIPSDASEDIDLTNNAAKLNLSIGLSRYAVSVPRYIVVRQHCIVALELGRQGRQGRQLPP